MSKEITIKNQFVQATWGHWYCIVAMAQKATDRPFAGLDSQDDPKPDRSSNKSQRDNPDACWMGI